jgi:parvulin-like peptidyl-prolyl isomerase
LVDVLLRTEAARLGVADATSPSDWMARLEAAGELPDPAPTEADMRAYHAANRRRFEVSEARRVRHVLVADQESARTVFEAALDANTLGRLAAEASLDEGSRHRRGDLGWVGRGQLAGTLEEAIFAAELHQVIGPVPSPFGWHVLAVDAVRPGRDRGFAECRSEIAAELSGYRRRRAWLDWLDRRVAEAIRVPAGTEHPLFRGLPGSTHRH